jgi:hypothetical protein
MSPTATIASIIVALVFFAWLFQSDTKDPGYEAYVKRQEEQRKTDQAQKASMNINVTDAGVTKDDSPLEFHKDGGQNPRTAADEGGGVFHPDGASIVGGTGNGDNPAPTTKTVVSANASHTGFGGSTKLNGTYVRVEYVGDVPAQAGADVPSITFRREGTFTTQNMAAADVDMEAGTTLVASTDRGSGRYKLFGNTLELTYTDGLTRHKGPKRSYVVAPVGGADNAPTAITIQGKIFKLDANR